MGELESKVRKKIRVGKVEKAVLATIYGAGALALAVAAPNALRLLSRSVSAKGLFSSKRAIDSLLEKKLVEFVGINGKKKLQVTDAGTIYLAGAIEEGQNMCKDEKWDGKWRIVIFDIPVKKRGLRNKIRAIVESFGFKLLQRSVWVSPYPREDLIVLLKAELKIGKDLLYIVADEIEYDKPLRQMFGLK